jgi:Fur family transcriptional regulator, peroxide stress response regulator
MMTVKLRNTRQRQIILEELKKVRSHPTADQVYEMVRMRLPNISLGTVYRNLEILSTQGQIQKLEFGRTQKRFDGTPENHYHFRCVDCGKIYDVPIAAIDNLDHLLDESSGFEVQGHNLELFGVCPHCRRQ